MNKFTFFAKKNNLILFFTILFFLCEVTYSQSLNQNLENGYQYYDSWTRAHSAIFDEFWHFSSYNQTKNDIDSFNIWHKQADFKDISPKYGNAYFFRGPSKNDVYMDEQGNLVFVRMPGNENTHTTIEPSVKHQAKLSQYVEYGGYRFMSLGTPYEIELEIMAVNGDWIQKVPWALAFQGHALPNFFDRFKKFNPPFALIISRGRWQAHIRADSRLSLPEDRSYQRFEKIDLGEVQPDIWTRFRIRVMWGYENYPPDGNTALGIWRDGVEYHKEWGRQNFYRILSLYGDELGPYLTMGAYLPIFEDEHGPVIIKIKEMVMRVPKNN